MHHSRTNHLTEGETHCPDIVPEERSLKDSNGKAEDKSERIASVSDALAIGNVLQHLLVGWPAYLLFGATGGSSRGISNHFVPLNSSLFPGKWKMKVLYSDLGIVTMLALLWQWARVEGSWTPVMLVYILPYLVVNCWLVLYTWLQHTDVDIPHLDADSWTWIRGAFLTVDRPYPRIIDFLHHHIGTTHVAHHINSKIPHYNAELATKAIRDAFPDFYLYDPTPVHEALFRVAKNCVAVEKREMVDVSDAGCSAFWTYMSGQIGHKIE